MGCCSATRIFDGVIESALKTDISDEALVAVVTALYQELTDMDWDCQCESEFFNHERIKPIIDEIEK